MQEFCLSFNLSLNLVLNFIERQRCEMETPASLGGVICLDFYEGQTLLSQWGNVLYPTALVLQSHIFTNISMSLMASSALPDSSALSITEVSAVKTFLLSVFPCILAK